MRVSSVNILPGFLILVLAFSGIVSACSSTPLSTTPPEIRIGVLAPRTGEFANSAGDSTVEGIELGAEQVNIAGGLSVGQTKYHIQVIIEDDQNNAQTAVQAARKLIVQDNVVAIIGLPSSITAIAASAVAESEKIPMISSSSTNPETTFNNTYVFRTSFDDHFQARILAQFVRQDLMAERGAILYDVANPYSKGLADYFKQEFETRGGKIVAEETYTSDVRDWTTQLTVIKRQAPDVLFLPNYEHEVPVQAEQARRIGITATLFGADAWSYVAPDMLASLEGGYYSAHWSPGIANEFAQGFMEDYYDAYEKIPGESAALAYDTLGLLFEAIQSQGRVDSESIRAGLASIEQYNGVTGSITYQGTGDPLRSIVMLRIEDNKPVFYQQVNP